MVCVRNGRRCLLWGSFLLIPVFRRELLDGEMKECEIMAHRELLHVIKRRNEKKNLLTVKCSVGLVDMMRLLLYVRSGLLKIRMLLGNAINMRAHSPDLLSYVVLSKMRDKMLFLCVRRCVSNFQMLLISVRLSRFVNRRHNNSVDRLRHVRQILCLYVLLLGPNIFLNLVSSVRWFLHNPIHLNRNYVKRIVVEKSVMPIFVEPIDLYVYLNAYVVRFLVLTIKNWGIVCFLLNLVIK